MTETHWNTCAACGTSWEMHRADDIDCPNPECAPPGTLDLTPELLRIIRVMHEICNAQIDPEHIAHNHTNWHALRDDLAALIAQADKVTP